MKLNLLLAALLSSLSVACYAADAVSGATPNHAAPGSQIKNVDAVTSASIVPQKLRISTKATGFTDSKAKKVLFVVGDPRFDQSLEGFLVNTAANFFLKKGYEVEIRDLYKIKFNPVITPETSTTPKTASVKPQTISSPNKLLSLKPITLFSAIRTGTTVRMQSPKATWSAYFLRNLLIRTRQKAWKDFSKEKASTPL